MADGVGAVRGEPRSGSGRFGLLLGAGASFLGGLGTFLAANRHAQYDCQNVPLSPVSEPRFLVLLVAGYGVLFILVRWAVLRRLPRLDAALVGVTAVLLLATIAGAALLVGGEAPPATSATAAAERCDSG